MRRQLGKKEVLIVICTGYIGRLSYEQVTSFSQKKNNFNMQVLNKKKRKTQKKPTKKPTLKPQWNFKILYIPTGDLSITVYRKKTDVDFFHFLDH